MCQAPCLLHTASIMLVSSKSIFQEEMDILQLTFLTAPLMAVVMFVLFLVYERAAFLVFFSDHGHSSAGTPVGWAVSCTMHKL